MEFARPEYFWMLSLIPLVALLWGLGLWHRTRMHARFGNIENLEGVSRISWSGRGWIRGLLFLFSLMLMVLGLAFPRMVQRELNAVPTPTDLVFMLDISPSMYARDMDPNRLERAEQIIQKFILLKQPQDRYGLVVFNHSSVVLSYLTADPQSILIYFDYLNQQEEPELGTNMGSAMTSALRLITMDAEANPELAADRRRVMILLSDGDDHFEQWAAPLAEIAKAEIKIYTFGLGTASGAYVPLVMSRGEIIKYLTREGGSRIVSRAEARTMRDVSEGTQARFFRGEDNAQVDEALEEILFTGRPVSGFQASPVRKDLYFYFLSAAFLCMAAAVFF